MSAVRILTGDCRDVLADLARQGFTSDACVTDPPYHLSSIVKRYGKEGSAPPKSDGATGVYARSASGFMGKAWDGGGVAFEPETWRLVFDVMKPGAHLVAFGGTRTYHRMVCAIEDAGFEIRDQIGWLYGSGFPKSHNLDGDGQGWGTALKPAWEPIVLARKPLIGTVAENVLEHGTGALNINGCRVEGQPQDFHNGSARSGGIMGKNIPGRGFAPGNLNGRWPANIVHDGSEEVVGAFPDAPGQMRPVGPEHGAKDSVNVYGDFGPRNNFEPRADTGSAARFFYCAKADKTDRAGSKHPTVKPLALMRWLVRLVTPPGGLVLDPFAGTGTTGQAALEEGMHATLIEREAEYVADIERRLAQPIQLGGLI